MNQLINDVAIAITQEVYTSLHGGVVELEENKNLEAKDFKRTMSYFQVREKIYDVLARYIKNYKSEFEYGKHDSRLPEEYLGVMLREAERAESHKMCDELMASGVFYESRYETPYHTKVTKNFLLIDINEVKKNELGTTGSMAIAMYHNS